MTKEELFAIAETKVELRPRYYISEGFEIFKKNAGGFVGFVFLNLFISVVLSLIPLIGGIVSSVLSILLSAGLIMVVRKIRNGETVLFNDFFDAFKNAGPPIAVSLMQGLIIGLTVIPGVIVFFIFFFAEFTSGAIPSSSVFFTMIPLFFLMGIPAIILAICYIFSMYIVLFLNQDFWTAMEASRRFVMKNFGSVLGFIFVLGLLWILVVVFTCGLGYFVMTPVSIASVYLAFEDIYKPDANTFETKIESFGLQERDINTEADEKSNS